MKAKKYSSYAQIDRELEILKLEKEISYQKLVLSVQNTKKSLTFSNISTNIFDTVISTISSSYGTILKLMIPFIIKWFRDKKRGN